LAAAADVKVEVGKKNAYDASEDKLTIKTRIAENLVQLSEKDNEYAVNMLRITEAIEMNRDESGDLNIEELFNSLAPYFTERTDVIAAIIMSDVILPRNVTDQYLVRKYAERMLKNYNDDNKEIIITKVLTANETILGEKLVETKQSAGAMEVKEVKEVQGIRQRVVERFVDVVRRLRNAVGSITITPAVIALNATRGEFDAITAYALGESRHISIIERLSMQMDALLGGRSKSNRILYDLNAFSSMLEAT
jgi:hypothetical protein